jgi:hypothetical protein
MELTDFKEIGWKAGMKIVVFGKGKEQHLTVLNVDLIRYKVVTERGKFFYKNIELDTTKTE